MSDGLSLLCSTSCVSSSARCRAFETVHSGYAPMVRRGCLPFEPEKR
jgi:hypothetical protein